jgi:hypothetical protein
MEMRSREIRDLKSEILQTIFSRPLTEKAETANHVTATKTMSDLQGVYATLEEIGFHVSNLFIFFAECLILRRGYENDLSVVHSYTVKHKLDSFESLIDLRQKMISANAPSDIVKYVDVVMLQKQNSDNPEYVQKFVTWEKYRPFNDKSEATVNAILSGSPMVSTEKIKFYFWAEIKSRVLDELGDGFYMLEPADKEAAINKEVEAIRARVIAEAAIETSDPGNF